MPGKETITKRFKSIAKKYPEITAILSKDTENIFQPITYKELYEFIKILGTGLLSIGIKRGDHIGIMSDNRKEWMMTDYALLGIGAIDVPRGSDSTADEIGYILKHADCPVTFAENKVQVDKILSKKKDLPLLKKIIVYDTTGIKELKKPQNIELMSFEDLMKIGENEIKDKPDLFETELNKGENDDLASLLYTSGTTGQPKGVMLTHRSFLFQVDRLPGKVLDLKPGQVFLSVLPIWHSFERSVEYIVLLSGVTLAFSKMVGAILLPDMQKVKPQWMASVPRLFESLRNGIFLKMKKEGGIKYAIFDFFIGVGEIHAYFYNMFYSLLPQFKKRVKALDIIISIIPLILFTPLKFIGNALVFSKIKASLGGNFIACISGGGALPGYVDKFFQAAGIKLLEGYGLTETAPVLGCREQHRPVTSTVGQLITDAEYKLFDKEGNILPSVGHKGILFIKSPQIMEGYYKQPEETEKVLKDGWLNTGDLAIFTHTGDYKIIGRVKETIVLTGGENIEPLPIEEKLCESDLIEQGMVVGQDKKFIGALIIPNMDAVENVAIKKNISYVDKEELITFPFIQETIHDEIQSLICAKTGFKSFERIFRIKIIPKPFEIGKELTQTLKIRRDVAYNIHRKEIEDLFK